MFQIFFALFVAISDVQPPVALPEASYAPEYGLPNEMVMQLDSLCPEFAQCNYTEMGKKIISTACLDSLAIAQEVCNRLYDGVTVVVIDPGHGLCKDCEPADGTSQWYEYPQGSGEWYRSPEPRCLTEIVVCLEVAQRTKRAIEARYPDIKVYLTRNSNTEWLPRMDRVAFADSVKADVFLSIHTNAYGYSCGFTKKSKKVYGTEVHIARSFEPNDTTRLPNYLHDKDYLLAKQVKKAMVSAGMSGHRNNGKIFQGRLEILRRNVAPYKVLSEIGYHTHPGDRQKLLSRRYQERFAQGYAWAIGEALGLNNPPQLPEVSQDSTRLNKTPQDSIRPDSARPEP